MVIAMSVLPPFTYPNLSLCNHGVIIVLCNLQIFSCPTIGNVARIPYVATLEKETSGVLMTLDAIYHRLEASSAEVTFGAIHCTESSPSDSTSP
jgi:hypothetical protein